MQLYPFLSHPPAFLSPCSCLTQDRGVQMTGALLSDKTRSRHQRSRMKTSGDPSSVRGRWPSRTSPSTPSQWLSESREWPKASSETGAWRSEMWWGLSRLVGRVLGEGVEGTGVISGYKWRLRVRVSVLAPSLWPVAPLFLTPATSCLISGMFTCTESPGY